MKKDVKDFLGPRADYYTRQFAKIEHAGHVLSFNSGAFFVGPIWAAARGLWWLFWLGLAIDVWALSLILRVVVDSAVGNDSIEIGIFIFMMGRIVLSAIANRSLLSNYTRWRLQPSIPAGFSVRRILSASVLLVAIAPLVIYRMLSSAPSERDCRSVLGQPSEATLRQYFDCLFIGAVPADRQRPNLIATQIDKGIEYLTVNFSGFFDGIAWAVRTVLVGLENLFVGVPWPVMMLLLILASWRMAGIKVAIFTLAALTYLAMMGFWQNAMATISLVAASVTIAVLLGIPIGILAAKSKRAHAVIHPVLDVMQTLPSFVYLIPAIALFSIGKTPAVLATVIYACPPLIRLTALGIRQVPETVKEAAIAFGAAPRQLLLKVEFPLATATIMTGINQSVMMSLAMSVIAALIGAGGLGFDVLFSLQQVQPGKGLLAGIAIALCAMIIDRSVQGSRIGRPA